MIAVAVNLQLLDSLRTMNKVLKAPYQWQAGPHNAFCALFKGPASSKEENMDAESFVKEKIKWLGHASFRIDGSRATVYIDPWKLKSSVPADIVCITHSHYDHLSEEDVEKIRKPSTVIVGPADCEAGFGDAFKVIAPGGSLEIGEVKIEAVPAYNTGQAVPPQKEQLGRLCGNSGRIPCLSLG